MLGEWLKNKIKEKGLTQEEFAKALGVSPSLVSSWVKGTRRIRIDDARRVAKLLGVSEKEIFLLAGILGKEAFEIEEEVVFIPLLSGKIPCGTPKENLDSYIEGYQPFPREMLEMSVGRSYLHGLKLYFVRAQGDSMIEVGIVPGSFIIFSPDLEVQSGDIALLYLDCSGLTVKQVFFQEKVVVLVSKNPRYEPVIVDPKEVSVVGKVLLWINYANHLRYAGR
ncbi:MAG: LexA family protein [Candidatus Caldatribacteriaceae bacterium]